MSIASKGSSATASGKNQNKYQKEPKGEGMAKEHIAVSRPFLQSPVVRSLTILAKHIHLGQDMLRLGWSYLHMAHTGLYSIACVILGAQGKEGNKMNTEELSGTMYLIDLDAEHTLLLLCGCWD